MLDLDMLYCCRFCKYVTFTDHSSLIVKLKLSDKAAYFIGYISRYYSRHLLSTELWFLFQYSQQLRLGSVETHGD